MSDFFSMAAAPPLRVGDAVVVLGLASAQEHNGATGTVVDVGAERCAVEVRHGEAARRLNVKPRHLRAIERPVLFSAREFERADPLSPALFAAVASAFAAREPWALPASSETVVAAELLDARGTILRRLCCAFEPGPEDRQPELAFTQSYAHHEALLACGPRRRATPLLVGFNGDPLLVRCHRAEDPDDEELAIVMGALEALPDFYDELRKRSKPAAFAKPLGYGAVSRDAPLREELNVTLREYPGDARVWRLRLVHPAVFAPTPRSRYAARPLVLPHLPAVAAAAAPPRDFAYGTLEDAVAHHRGEARRESAARHAHGLALAVALSLCRTEAAHREALAVVADLVGRVAAGTDLADAAAALFRDLSDVVGA